MSDLEYEQSHKRALAHIVDTIVVIFPIYLLVSDGGGGDDLAIVISALFFLGYMTIVEGKFGQSLGKKLFRIKVTMEDGSSCSFKAALIRNILRVIDALPTLYIVGILAISFTDKRQRIGDLVAGTVVVKDK